MAPIAQSVLITGASRGLGLELVRQIAESSPKVLIAACRNPDGASDLQEFAKKNKSVKVIKLDVESDDDIDAAVKKTKSLVGDSGLNLLINNAGIYLNKPDGGSVRIQTRERMQRHFNVNATSPIILTQKFLPLLEAAAKSQEETSLSCSKAASVIVSSRMGSQQVTYESGAGTSIDYKCSKSAVNMAAVLMSQQLKDAGVMVLALHPGWVQTDMGGSEGTLTATDSVKGMLEVMVKAGKADNGRMVDHLGKVVDF